MTSKASTIGLLGKNGRMGSVVQNLIKQQSDRFFLTDDLLNADAVIDFSSPECVKEFIEDVNTSKNARAPILIVGSTPWKNETLNILEKYLSKNLVFQAANFSAGVFFLTQILEKYSKKIETAGFVVSMEEQHHIHKKDAPSGTAVRLQKAIRPADPSSIPTKSIREGETIGVHDVFFEKSLEKLSFSHHAKDRSLFAQGALDVSHWLCKNKEKLFKKNKILHMEDWLLENN